MKIKVKFLSKKSKKKKFEEDNCICGGLWGLPNINSCNST